MVANFKLHDVMKTYQYILIFFTIISCQKDITSHLSDKSVTTPKLFLEGIVTDTAHLDFGMTISPDAKTVLFTRRIGEAKQKIYETNYINGNWTQPVIATFSTDRDESPHFSPDGKTVYFGSERPIPNRPNKGSFDMNVWKTTRINGKWSEPEVLPENINAVQIEGEEWPSSNLSHFVTADEKTFYTGTLERGEKGIDIYKTIYDGKNYSNLEKLSNRINKEDKWEYAPVVSPDGNYLFTQIYNRDDGFGGDDIFVSKKDVNGNWQYSVNLGNLINTEMNECPASMSSDGKYFFFTRDYKEDLKQYDGIPNIYFIETKALKLDKLFAVN